MLLASPQEGPHSVMNEEEFFDAIDATLDKIDKDDEKVSGVTRRRVFLRRRSC